MAALQLFHGIVGLETVIPHIVVLECVQIKEQENKKDEFNAFV